MYTFFPISQIKKEKSLGAFTHPISLMRCTIKELSLVYEAKVSSLKIHYSAKKACGHLMCQRSFSRLYHFTSEKVERKKRINNEQNVPEKLKVSF